MNKMKAQRFYEIIEKHGIVLVFPIKNQKEPYSLWQALYPRHPLRWEWSDDGDDRVMKLWMDFKKLSQDKKVVYSKWYQGRATFFSREVFLCLLSFLKSERSNLSRKSIEILEILESDSPLSTKELKKITDLQGKDHARIYQKSLNSLFEQLWIVGFGEVDDGAFPSLAVGATSLIFEDLYKKSQTLDPQKAEELLQKKLGHQPKILKKIYQIRNSHLG